jgi:hypothetical protein
MMQIQSNLVKSKLYASELPWNEFDPDKLGPTVMQFFRDHEPFFRRWADTWFENFQFLFGNHNIRWSKRLGIAVDYDNLKTASPFAGRSQTNLARIVAEALASLLYGTLPTWEVDAMEESKARGKRFKKIVQKYLDCQMNRQNMDQQLYQAAMIMAVFGQVGAKIDWNPNGGQLMEIPAYRKVKKPVFTTWMAPNQATMGLLETPTPQVDATGQPYYEDSWEAVLDQQGRQVINRFFAGEEESQILTPFEYRREVGSAGMYATKWIEHMRLLDYDDYLDQYDQVPGKTKHFGTVRPVYGDRDVMELAVQHFMRMQFTTPPAVDDSRRVGGVLRSQLFRHKVFVIEHYDRPHPQKWPMGRKLVIVNGQCTHVTTPTYKTNKKDGWHPFAEAQWMTVAPNSIGAGPLNDVIRKNREMNVIDSLIATSVRRNMGSKLLIKAGSGLDPQRMTGAPGEMHEVSDPFAVRWLHDDMPIPPVIKDLREMHKDDVYETSGAGDALRGERPSNVSSGYAMKQLEEREEKRLTPARKNFEAFVSTIGEKKWACMKTNVVQLSDEVMGYLKRAGAGEYTTDDVVSLISNQIDFGVDISVGKSSMAVKSKASQQATVQELSQGALGQRLSTDAKVLDKYLEFFDAEVLRDASSSHRDRSERENETFLDLMRLGNDSEGIKKPVVIFEDDDGIHQAEHAEFFVRHSEEMLANPQALQEFLVHLERHRLQAEEKLGSQAPGTSLQVPGMMQQAAAAPAPGVQQIYQSSIIRQQQQQQQPPAATGQKQAPQAPRGPKPVGVKGGAGPTNPAAPSGNTPTANAPGGATNAA